jgi:hypothetical protein
MKSEKKLRGRWEAKNNLKNKSGAKPKSGCCMP